MSNVVIEYKAENKKAVHDELTKIGVKIKYPAINGYGFQKIVVNIQPDEIKKINKKVTSLIRISYCYSYNLGLF